MCTTECLNITVHVHVHVGMAIVEAHGHTFGLSTVSVSIYEVNPELLAHHILLVWLWGSEEVHETSHHHLLLFKVVGIRSLRWLVCLVLHQRRQQLEE